MTAVRVLVVDDEPELVSALVERLEIRGFDAKGVTEGIKAVELVQQESFHVAIVDLKMPGISGLEVITQLRAKLPDIKCILLTGHGAAENAEKGRECGAYQCMMKPVNIDVLAEALHTAADCD
jgi:DNA-binding response OmpR family regulator